MVNICQGISFEGKTATSKLISQDAKVRYDLLLPHYKTQSIVGKANIHTFLSLLPFLLLTIPFISTPLFVFNLLWYCIIKLLKILK